MYSWLSLPPGVIPDMIVYMDILYVVTYAVLGACFGSFAGATAWRLHECRDFVSDRSECEYCHHKLSAWDLVPVLSWLLLLGRCRYCKKPIGWSAIAVEVLSGLAFVASYMVWPYGFGGALELAVFVFWLIALVFMSILFVYDMRWKLLPNVVMLPLIVIGLFIFVGRQVIVGAPVVSWPIELGLAMLPITGFYGLLYMVSDKKWVGLGDVKLGVFMGLVLPWSYGLAALFLANLLGTVFVLPRLLRGRSKSSSHIAFGPFLIVATVVVFLWGSFLINTYAEMAGLSNF